MRRCRSRFLRAKFWRVVVLLLLLLLVVVLLIVVVMVMVMVVIITMKSSFVPMSQRVTCAWRALQVEEMERRRLQKTADADAKEVSSADSD